MSWKVGVGAVLFVGTICGQPSNLSLVSVTAQQAVIQYTAPNQSPCTFAVTDTSGMNVTVWDVNDSVFPGANTDLSRANTVVSDEGRLRRVVLGKRSAEPGANGKLYSRSLQANAPHTVTVTCTGGGSPLNFRTLNIPVGNMAPDPPAFEASGFGNAAWPTIDWGNRNTVYIDPKTGVLLKPATWPGDIIFLRNSLLFNKQYDSNLSWGNATNILSGNTSAVANSSTTDPIFVSLNSAFPAESSNWAGFSVQDLRVRFHGRASGGSRQVDFCLSADSGQTCLSGTHSVTLPSSTGEVLFPAGAFPIAPFAAWGIQQWPQHNLVMPVTTTVNTAGTTIHNVTGAPSARGLFQSNLAPGSKVVVAGSPCPDSLCTVATVRNAIEMTLNENVGTLNAAAFTSANFGLKVWKHAAGGSTDISLSYDVAFSGTPGFLIEDGASDQCNRNAVTLTQNVTGGTVPPYRANLCVLQYPGGSVLYAFIPSTGEMRLVGMVYTVYGAGLADNTNPRLPPNPWDVSDARTLYGHGFQADTGAPEILKWVYRGNGRVYTPGALEWEGVNRTVPNGQGVSSCQASEQLAGNMCASFVTNPNQGHDLRTQANALSLHMANGAFGNNPIPVSVVGNLFVSRWNLQQDGVTMFSYVNLATGVMTTGADTMWSTPNARWGGMHTAAGWVINNRYHLAALNSLGSRFNSGPFAGPYKSAVRYVWRSTDGVTGTWDTNTAVGSDYFYSCPMSECGTAVGQGLRLRISGMPCSNSANANEKSHYPCPWDSQQGMLDQLRVGDLLGDLAQPAGGAFSEELEILRITVMSPTDVELWVRRRVGPAQSSFANGWSVSPFPSHSCTSATWWYDTTAPLAAVLPDDCSLAGHIDVGVGPGNTFSATTTFSAKFAQPAGPAGIAAPLYSIGGFGTWAQRVQGVNFPGNSRVELYPSLRQWSAPDSERVWAADWRAYQGGAFTANGGGTEQDNIGFAPVTTGGRTHVWKVASPYPSQPKVLPMETWAGRFILRDVSGPDSNLRDADEWSYCVVYKAGECIAGGATSVGEVYLSASAAIINGMGKCYTNHFEAALPCIVPASPLGTWAVQNDISVNDPSSWRFRRLTMAFNTPSRQFTATNWRAMPDASWGLMLTTYADGVFPVMFAARIPTWPGYDQMRRDNFMPKPVQLGPGEALAEIRFGYEEFGTVEQFYCTSRRESCITGTSSPFHYITADGHAGTSCAAGCTISIPALSGRMLWWQEYRSVDGGTNWSAKGPLQVAAVE